MDCPVSLDLGELLDNQVWLVLKDHGDLMVSRELQETLVHQDVWVFLDLRVLLEVLAHRVSLGHRDLPDNWEQLDSQVWLLAYCCTYFVSVFLSNRNRCDLWCQSENNSENLNIFDGKIYILLWSLTRLAYQWPSISLMGIMAIMARRMEEYWRHWIVKQLFGEIWNRNWV